MWPGAGRRPPGSYLNGEEMVVKERIVVDLLFNDINTCVQTVKAWFVDKGYKKITARNPDRWSTAVILDIARGGLMSKTTIQATFKSHAGGNSIMIEFVGSNDGSGLSGKPAMSMAPDPKDKPYEALAMELSKFVKATWKRGTGPGLATMPTPAPSTIYQTSTPSYSNPSQQQYGNYEAQQYPQYGTYQEQSQTGYDASGGYAQQDQQTNQDYQQQQPVEQAPETPEAQPAETAPQPAAEGPMSDEEVARLEAELAQQEAEERAAQQVTPSAVAPAPEPEIPTPEPMRYDTPAIAPPVVEELSYAGPPAPVVPEPQPPSQVEAPPEPITPEPILEPKPEVAPVTPEPVPEVAPAPIQPVAAPTETFCPGCGKKTKPKWKTCPYCERDLSGTKAAEPAPVVETPAAQPAVETPVEQAQPTVPQQEQPTAVAAPTIPVCPTCNQPTTWIEDYKRFYCYTCQKYM